MERYHDFQLKDHYFWTDAAPEYVTKEERQNAKANAEALKPTPIKNPTYRSYTVREKDGSLTYYDAQVRREPVRINGIMI
jgi:hypothetical protein